MDTLRERALAAYAAREALEDERFRQQQRQGGAMLAGLLRDVLGVEGGALDGPETDIGDIHFRAVFAGGTMFRSQPEAWSLYAQQVGANVAVAIGGLADLGALIAVAETPEPEF